MNTIKIGDFYSTLNELLEQAKCIDNDSRTIENIERGYLTESTTEEEMAEPIKQFALDHYRHQRYETMLAVLRLCKKLGSYTDVAEDCDGHELNISNDSDDSDGHELNISNDSDDSDGHEPDTNDTYNNSDDNARETEIIKTGSIFDGACYECTKCKNEFSDLFGYCPHCGRHIIGFKEEN